MPNDDLDTLYTTLYPSTAAARRAYGESWDSTCSPSLLDWTVILPSLWRAGFVVPGPTIDRVSFWYVTWRFERFQRTFQNLEAMLVGPGWEGCIGDALRRGTTTGPKRLKHGKYVSRHVFRTETANQGLTYAFRFLDEPVRWESKKLRRRRVRGVAPTRWQHVPWYAPSDLEERHCSPDDHRRMGEDEAEKQAAEAIEILKNTIIGSSNDLEIEESISALYTLVSVYRLKPAGIQAFQLMGVAKIRLGNMLVQRITNLLDEFKKTKAIERLNEASGYASRIPEPSMREACNSEIAELRNEHGIEEPLISDSRKEGPSRPTGRSR